MESNNKTNSITQYHESSYREFERLSNRYFSLKDDFNESNKILQIPLIVILTFYSVLFLVFKEYLFVENLNLFQELNKILIFEYFEFFLIGIISLNTLYKLIQASKLLFDTHELITKSTVELDFEAVLKANVDTTISTAIESLKNENNGKFSLDDDSFIYLNIEAINLTRMRLSEQLRNSIDVLINKISDRDLGLFKVNSDLRLVFGRFIVLIGLVIVNHFIKLVL